MTERNKPGAGLLFVFSVLGLVFESWVVQRVWAWHLTAWAPTPTLVQLLAVNLIVSLLVAHHIERDPKEMAAVVGGQYARAVTTLVFAFAATLL